MFEMPKSLSESELQQKRKDRICKVIEEIVRSKPALIKRFMSDPDNVNDTLWNFQCVIQGWYESDLEMTMVDLYLRFEHLLFVFYPSLFDTTGKEPQFDNEDVMWEAQERFDYWFNHYYRREHPDELIPPTVERGIIEAIAVKVGYKVIHPEKSKQLTMF